MELTGGCLCKAVSYRIAEAPVTARACWCRMCQTIGGGSGTVNALFNTTALTVNGELKQFTFIADSGNDMYCRFCPICGTHLLVTSQRRPHFTAVRPEADNSPLSDRPMVHQTADRRMAGLPEVAVSCMLAANFEQEHVLTWKTQTACRRDAS
jgi:hypothetical protein